MGWERKRGKIEELNRLLRSPGDTGFSVKIGDLSILPSVRYVLTLDADTRLPRGAARTLIGIISHPLNRPVVDAALRRVTEGYGILQPRVSVNLTSAAGSLFARVYAGHTGVDPYTTAVSDTYQDLFGAGIFTGKGLYDVDAFQRDRRLARPRERAAVARSLRGAVRAHRARLRRGGGGRLPRQRPRARAAAAPLGARRLADPRLALPGRPDTTRVSRRTASRSSVSGRSSTTSGAASWRPRSSPSSGPRGPSCRGARSSGPSAVSRSSAFPFVASLFHLLRAAPRARAGPRPPSRPRRGSEHRLRAGAPDAGLPPIPRLGDGACHRPDAGPARHHAAPPPRVGDRGRAGGAGRWPSAARGSRPFFVEMAASPIAALGLLAAHQRRASGRSSSGTAVPRLVGGGARLRLLAQPVRSCYAGASSCLRTATS